MAVNLYAYTYPQHRAELRLKLKDPTDDCLPYPGLWVKLGDSHREAEVRMSEQGGAAEARDKETIRIWNNVTSIKRDYEVHEILERNGYRPKGYATGRGREWFLIPAKTQEEALEEIEKVLATFGPGTTRKDVKLRHMQQVALDKATKTIRKAKAAGQTRVNVVANLCPRFGKTIWALSLFNYLYKKDDVKVMILPAYWLSVHTSFSDTVPQFREFMNMVVIDTREDDPETKVRTALKDGKQVVLQVSLHGDPKEWKAKNTWLQTLGTEVFVFSDEADFGSHTENQVEKLRFVLEEGKIKRSVNVFASGTNIQRIAKNAQGQKIDTVIDVAYSQLEKTERSFVRRNYYSLRYDGLHDLLEREFTEDQRPSWSKIWKKPRKCQDFITGIIGGLLGKNDDLAGLNLSQICRTKDLDDVDNSINGIMLFTSAEKAGMKQAAEFLTDEYADWRFVELNGDYTSNKEAEDEVRQAINEARLAKQKGFVVITNMMGSRSFSIPEIQASVIMYDNGSVDATSQKVSRCLTPGKDWYGASKDVGHICSFSFDPNRNETIETLVLYEAIQVSRSEGISFADAVKLVNKTVNIFKIHDAGDPMLVQVDELFKIYGENENLLKVADVSVDITTMFEKDIIAILSSIDAGSAGKDKEKMAKLAPKAQKWAVTPPKVGKTSAKKDADAKAFEKLVNRAVQSINRSATTVYYMATSGKNYRDCLVKIAAKERLSTEFRELYGITPEQTITLVDENVLNVALLDVVVENSRKAFDTSPFGVL